MLTQEGFLMSLKSFLFELNKVNFNLSFGVENLFILNLKKFVSFGEDFIFELIIS